MNCAWSNPAESPFEAIIGKMTELAAASTPPDFSRILVIVPGRLWSRQLKDALVRRFPQGVCPPHVLTPGGALHYGLENQRCASPGEEMVVWEEVLNAQKKNPLFRCLYPKRETECSEKDCRAMAKSFAALRQELVQSGMTVADAAAILSADEREDAQRWPLLAKLEALFTDALAKLGLTDPVIANRECVSAASAALLTEKFAHVLVAFVPDLPRLLEEKLALISDGVTVLAHGEASESETFDAWGRPAAAWRSQRLPFSAENLHAVTNPEQAALLVLKLATRGGKEPWDYQKSAVVLGSPGFFPAFDATFRKVRYAGEEKAVALFSPEGVRGTALRIAGFLQKLCAVLHDVENFSALNTLLRDDAFSGYLRSGTAFAGENELLDALDAFTLEALPDGTTASIALLERRGSALGSVIRRGGEAVQTLAHAADFCAELKQLLNVVFSRDGYPPVLGISFDDEVRYWQRAIESLRVSPVQECLRSAERKLRYLLDECGNARFYPGRDDDAILVYNFLEIPALTQPELFLVGMNWGVEPAVRGVTPYLTDSIRKKLGLENFEGLSALENYKLSMLLRGKPDTQLLVLKYDSANTPLRPTGLLFEGCGEEELLQRSARCLNAETPGICRKTAHGDCRFRLNWSDAVRQGFFQKEPLEFSVTDFKTYLNSPRLFLLQKVFRVDCPDYTNGELTDSDFGTACHHGFEALPGAHCTTEAEYARTLKAGADRYLFARCGNPLPLVVEMQRRQIHLRLDAAARYLAEAHGSYRLLEAEYAICGGKRVPFGSALIKGKIDRIELSNDGRTLRLIDVKTYNSAEHHTPEKDHLKGDELVNLQLPLYHQLLLRDEAFWSKHNLIRDWTKIEVGYLLLTADSDVAELKLWENTPGKDASAGSFDVCSSAAEAKVREVVAALEAFRATGELPPEPGTAKYFDLAPLLGIGEPEASSEEGAQK